MPTLKLVSDRISIHRGLDGQDDHIEALMFLWEELQLSALEIAAQPECDLISFAQSGFFFGVITSNTWDEGRLTTTEGSSAEISHSLQPTSTNFDPSMAVAPELISGSWVPRSPEEDDGTDGILDDLAGFANRVQADNADNQPAYGWRSWFGGSNRGVPETTWDFGSSSSRWGRQHQLPDDTSNFLAPFSAPAAEVSRAAVDRSLTHAAVTNAQQTVIGLIYLAASPFTQSAPNQVGELNLGIILDSAHRGKGYAREAIQLVLRHAFEVEHCHRIQASILNLDWAHKDRMVSLLTQLRFVHEGTRRRAFFNPIVKEWQNVTTLAILETDWALRTVLKPAPKSLWDELFLRHEREREELLRWEETQHRALKRTASTETLRAGGGGGGIESGAETDANATDATVFDSFSVASSMDERQKLQEHDPFDDSSSEYDSGSDFNDLASERADLVEFEVEFNRTIRAASPAPSDSSVESVPLSTVSSDWDMLD